MAINRKFSNYLYGLNLLIKQGWCYFCPKTQKKKGKKEVERHFLN
jgi:hypothetical protein